MTLREVFTPLISYTLLLARTPAQQRRPFADIRGEMNRMLEEHRTLIRRHDISLQDYEAACFAVVAWIDELVLAATHESNPEVYNQWKRAPLQVERFNTANAGEEFYDKLEGISPAQREVREIYYLCLSLGFRGRYYDDSQEFKVVGLRRDLSQKLPTPVLELIEIERKRERVTPQPYDVPAPPRRALPRSYSAVVWVLLALLALAGVVWALLQWPEPGRTKQQIMADVEKRLLPFECCNVKVVDFDNGTVILEGSIESDEQRQQVAEAAKEVREVKGVRDSLRFIPRPFCEVIELLAPFQQRSADAGVDLRGAPHKGCDQVYFNGENLVIDVSAQRPLQYVYIDYYVADREYVAHVVPNPRQPDNFLQGATGLTVGAPGTEPRWAVQAPFGLELVTVIAAKKQLFERPRLVPEKARSYLGELRRVLPADADASDVAASYCFITTQDGR
jgi:type VI secretion system protein ImpK